MKGNRQDEILKIIEQEIILTQDDLQNALNRLGYKVTQSTVSRDIKQLRLIKGHDKDGNYRYMNSLSKGGNEQSLSHYYDIITRSATGVDYALNNIVVKCYNGMAQSVCVALDTIFKNDMIGSIAGDDTVLIIARSENDAQALYKKIKNCFKGSI